MAVTFLPPPLSNPKQAPVPYTGDPFLLCYSDILLFFKCAWAIPGIFRPWVKWLCGPLDELYPSIPNLIALALHGFLFIIESIFLLSLPFLIILPIWVAIVYMVVVFGIVWLASFALNGRKDVRQSRVDLGEDTSRHPEECWIYLNGVCIGWHWLQSNLDRLALTFRRPITGVHNRTYGLIFDLIQCIIERNFCYATADVRRSYATIKSKLLKNEYKNVILILHSQGGIEGGLILDWLLDELPYDIINKLEIYTFGSAANHFNNPPRHSKFPSVLATSHKLNAVRHIEHYADDGEFVAQWGVLTFARMQNRYMGRVFIRPGTGHLLNQHYLNSIFPLGENRHVLENNDFMNMDVSFTSDGVEDKAGQGLLEALLSNGNGVSSEAVVEDRQYGVKPLEMSWAEEVLAIKRSNEKPRVRDFSRLWCYRNGRSPKN